MKERPLKVLRDSPLERIDALESVGKIVVIRHPNHHLILTNPRTRSTVEFFPTRGTIVRDSVKQFRRGLDAALRLIGVREVA